jgi:hypothetical protein
MPQAAASIQLPFEKALKAFLVSQNLSAFFVAQNIFCAHEKTKLDQKSWLAIIAGLPLPLTHRDTVLACRVQFEVATHLSDPVLRLGAVADHADRVGLLMQMFSEVNGLDTLAAFMDENAAWRGIGISGWEPEPPTDGQTETQIVATVPYLFKVYLEA